MDFCEHHKPRCKTMGYVEHAEWMERQGKKGERQKKCPDCGRWLFPKEVGKKRRVRCPEHK